MNNIEPKKKTSEYDKFIAWCALPSDDRQPATQKELAKLLKVEEATLSHWKDREDFDKRKNQLTKEWFKKDTPDVINALKFKAKRGDTKAIELYLKFIENWVETQRIDQTSPVLALLQKFDLVDEHSKPKSPEGQTPKEISQP